MALKQPRRQKELRKSFEDNISGQQECDITVADMIFGHEYEKFEKWLRRNGYKSTRTKVAGGISKFHIVTEAKKRTWFFSKK